MTIPHALEVAYAAGVEPRHVMALVDAALKTRVTSTRDTVEIGASTFESDGRKASRTARLLTDAGLLRPVHSKHMPDGARYQLVIDKALEMIEARKPTLDEKINDWQRSAILEERSPIGIKLEQLAPQEQLWVLTYPHEYRLFWVGNHQAEIEFKLGDAPPENHWRMSVHVSDAALREVFERVIRERKIESLMAHNAGWAIEKLAKIDPETVKTFIAIGDLGFGRGETKFAGDPATWAETAKIFTERAQAKLQRALQDVEATVKVMAAVAQHGGWDKLGSDLRVLVEEKLDRKEAE